MLTNGLDVQGNFQVEHRTPVTWITGDDRRLVRDSSTFRLYIGENSAYREVLQDLNYFNIGWPTNLKASLDQTYHPINGSGSYSFTAPSYNGIGGYIRTPDSWFKLKDDTPITTGQTAGIKVEYGSTASDVDDAAIYFNGTDRRWYIDDPDNGADKIAREDFVSSYVSIFGLGVAQGAQIWRNRRPVRVANTVYTNNDTSKPIAVCITRGSSAGVAIRLYISGVQIGSASQSNGGSDRGILFGIVPPGEDYQVTGTDSHIYEWSEIAN